MSTPSTRAARPTSLPRGISPGGLGARVLAYVIDVVVLWVIMAAMAAGVLYGSSALKIVALAAGGLLWIAWAVFLWYRLALTGATVGMAVLKLELIAHRTGRPIGWGKVFVRGLIFGVLGGTGIGLIVLLVMMIIHPLHQGWHDLAVQAVMIKARERSPQTERSVDRARVPHNTMGSAMAHNAVGLPPHLTGGQSSSFAPRQSDGPSRPGQPSGSNQPGGPAQQPHGGSGSYGRPPLVSARSAVSPPGPGPHGSGAAGVPSAWAPQHGSFGGAASAGSPPPASADSASLDTGESTRLVPRRGGVPSRSPSQGWVVALDDGRQVAVSGMVLLGRDPAPRPGEQAAELVTVSDNSRTVSKTHLAVGVDNKGVYVMDRGSTNGSAIAASTGKYEPCPPGELVRVREGQIVSFGDHRLEIRRSY